MLTKKYLKSIASSIFILLFIILSPPAIAANEALLELLKVPRDKGTLSPQEYELLLKLPKRITKKLKKALMR